MNRSLILCTLLATTSVAEEPPASPFEALEYLAGHCWKAQFDDGLTDEQCYDWLYGGKFLRSRHVVDSDPPYEGTTIFSWDPENDRIRFHYFTSKGAVSEGYLQSEGDTIRIPETYVGEDGETRVMETVYRRNGDREYRVVSREKTADGWQELWTLEFRRVDDPGSAGSSTQP